MELKSFTEFQDLLAETQARKDALGQEIAKLGRELAAREAKFNEAIVEGGDPEKLQKQVDTLAKKIELKTREWNALDAATSGKVKTGPIHQAARKVWEEGCKIITEDLRAEWNAELVELEKAKAIYLAACAALGAVQRKADDISSKLSWGLEGFLPPAGTTHLAVGIYPEKLIGVIFFDPMKIKNAFQRGEA